MPGRLIVATLGFHEHFALRLLNRFGAGHGDYVAAVTVKPPVAAVFSAWRSLAGIASRLGVEPLELHQIDPADLEAATASLVEWLEQKASQTGATHTAIEATGGARILTVTALLAAITLAGRRNIEVYIQSDTSQVWQARITPDLIEALTTPLSKEKAKILDAILNAPGSTPQTIAKLANMHPKTLLNHITKLKKLKLIIQKGRGRGLYPTPRAKLALRKAKTT